MIGEYVRDLINYMKLRRVNRKLRAAEGFLREIVICASAPELEPSEGRTLRPSEDHAMQVASRYLNLLEERTALLSA
jgi:hypothetical protein